MNVAYKSIYFSFNMQAYCDFYCKKNFTSAVFMPFHERDAAVSQSCDGHRSIAVQPFYKCGTAEK